MSKGIKKAVAELLAILKGGCDSEEEELAEEEWLQRERQALSMPPTPLAEGGLGWSREELEAIAEFTDSPQLRAEAKSMLEKE